MARTGVSSTVHLGRDNAATPVDAEDLPLSNPRVLAGIVAVSGAAVMADLHLASAIWAAFFAVSLVLLGFWLARWQDLLVLAGLASGLVVAGYLAGAPDLWGQPVSDAALLNRLIVLLVIWATAAALIALKRRQEALRDALAREAAKRAEIEAQLALALRHVPGTTELSERVADLDDVGHEVRTLLNAIIGFSDLAKQQIFGPHPDRRYGEYMVHINDSGARLLSVFERHMAAISPGDHGVETGARRAGGGTEPFRPEVTRKRCVNG